MRSDTLNLPIAVTIRNRPANQDPIVLGWLEALDVNSAAWPTRQTANILNMAIAVDKDYKGVH